MKETEKDELAINEMLRWVAPGTAFREGLDNVLSANTGALIVMGYDEKVEEIVDGGFHINCPYSPTFLYELAKMDGAIILSNDGKRILFANAQLVPHSSIPTKETGTRHRNAQRCAKQTGKLVVSISQRRNTITLYRGGIRYVLKDQQIILSKANQALQTLEKYRTVLSRSLMKLSAFEFEELVTLQEVAFILQRIEMNLRVIREINRYVHELGTEGRLVSMQMEELISNLDEEASLFIRDYSKEPGNPTVSDVFLQLKKLDRDELLIHQQILRILGYHGINDPSEHYVSSRGNRILQKIPRLPYNIVQNMTNHFRSLSRMVVATIEELDEVEGIGEVRARNIHEGLKRIQEQVFIDRHM
ncbi:DNA integrity scanning diadenylate cyclase DisA [Risungbinella massiliensis]|uniref:DNA integrity scanning diadenylate cyclase DisA n=1 Tax=Risungbinella massiliensis TaxID=1329796 RepID=UPI0005CC7469|nr:DNA integrity scanning diadenylate cyclase DisA [Risungbinella massiliensis]